MLNYKIVNKRSIFTVVETDSNLIIKQFNQKKEAVKLLRLLNSGSGFQGFTPPFVVAPVKIPISS